MIELIFSFFELATASSTSCSNGSKLYQPGDEFVTNCNKRCRCQNNGQVKCVSLCPNDKSSCMVDHTEKNVLVPTLYNKCQCTAKACKPFPYNGKFMMICEIYSHEQPLQDLVNLSFILFTIFFNITLHLHYDFLNSPKFRSRILLLPAKSFLAV